MSCIEIEVKCLKGADISSANNNSDRKFGVACTGRGRDLLRKRKQETGFQTCL